MGKPALTSHMRGRKHILAKSGRDISYGIGVFMLRKQQASQEMATGSSKETVSEPVNEEKIESANEPVVTLSVESPPTPS
ncbi:hypothetical protein PR048_020491 [Dryococelus australis]|uniref:Uncharacterized protein n=1 Tax=Dryococelus australis TaxID=614101 RepID=A0ABQ9H6E5_9NEOP|nr:hypothetical protein PR048_020491 [Dryococelus australis]